MPAALDDEVLLERGRAHAGEIGDDVALGQRGHRDLLLGEYVRDALGIRRRVLFFIRLHRVGPDEQVVVHGVQDAAALRVRLGDGVGALDGRDRVHEGTGLAVEDAVRAAAGVNGEEAVACHARHFLGEHAGRIDDERGVQRAAVGVHGGDLSVRDVHAQHGGVERDARAVLHGVFCVGDRQPVGADAAGVRVGDGEAGLFVEVRLAPEQLPAGDEAGVRDAVVVFAPHTVAPHGGAQPAVLEADVLPHAGKRHVELLADLIEHGVAAPDVFVLDAAAAEVDARMHLAVVAPGGAEREVTLLVDDQDVKLLARKLTRDRHARDAAADDEHVGRLPVERVVAQRGHAHGCILAACKRDVVDDMARGILRCSHLAGAHNVVPAVKRAAQDDAVVLQRRRDLAAEGFVQFSVQNGDPHNRGASQTVSRSADRLNRSNIPFFRCKVKNGACGKSAEIFLSY